MSSLLNQAVELAQAGQRDQARQLLWQYIQTSPDNEVAWLWLASVAVDQPEYVRALNEVLRINPANPRAQQLLAEFQQQYGSVPGASTPPIAHAAPPQPISVGPSSPPPSPPATPSYQPPPPAQQQGYTPDYGADYGTPDYGGPRKPKDSGPQERIIERERIVERRKRGGCFGCLPGCGCLGCGGCGQSCLVALVLLIVLPAAICGALSYANFSLGPLDFPASYLPEQFGTKTIMFDADQYEIKIEAPRSWYLVSDQNDMWVMWRDALDEVAQFEDLDLSWENFEDLPSPLILETNPIAVHMNGYVVGMTMQREVEADFDCEAIYARRGEFDAITDYDNNLCGYTFESTEPYTGPDVFVDTTPPNALRIYRFVVPVTDRLGLEWEVTITDDMTSFYGPRVDRLIESVEVVQK